MRTNKYFISCQLFKEGRHIGNYMYGLEYSGIKDTDTAEDILTTIQRLALEDLNKVPGNNYSAQDVHFVSINIIDSHTQQP